MYNEIWQQCHHFLSVLTFQIVEINHCCFYQKNFNCCSVKRISSRLKWINWSLHSKPTWQLLWKCISIFLKKNRTLLHIIYREFFNQRHCHSEVSAYVKVETFEIILLRLSQSVSSLSNLYHPYIFPLYCYLTNVFLSTTLGFPPFDGGFCFIQKCSWPFDIGTKLLWNRALL